MTHNHQRIEMAPGLTFLVAEEQPAQVPVSPAPAPTPTPPAAPQAASPRRLSEQAAMIGMIGIAVAALLITAVMGLAGLLTPVRGNIAVYLLIHLLLFCIAGLIAVFRPDDEPEETAYSAAHPCASMCAPTRNNTITGRNARG